MLSLKEESRSNNFGLFHKVPESFFTLLTSKHKNLYLRALFVVLDCYRTEIVVHKEDLISALCASLEDQMYLYSGEEDELAETPVSERAHALLRKLKETGWVESEQALRSFDEQYLIPDYAHKLITVLKEIDDDRPQEYNSLVSTTYSALFGAEQKRGEHGYDVLLQVHRMTQDLRDQLVKLSNNMRKYYLMIQELSEVKAILQEHFDHYHTLINERIYHPLKTFDSIDRFKVSILRILKNWLIDDEYIEIMASRPTNTPLHSAKEEIFDRLTEIIRIYEYVLPQLLKQIDLKHNAYIKSSVSRMQYLMNRDRGFKGRLIQVLRQLGDQPKTLSNSNSDHTFPFYEFDYIHEESLYKVPKRAEKHDPPPLETEDVQEEQIIQEMLELQQHALKAVDRKKVEQLIRKWMDGHPELHSSLLPLESMDDFLRILMSVIVSDEENLPYKLEVLDGYVKVNGYQIPNMKYSKVETNT